MDRRRLLNLLIASGAFLVRQGIVAGQNAGSEANLTVEEVVRMTRAGFSEELIVTKIKKNAKAFDLSTEELVDLRKAGVSDNVIKYMLDPSQPYAPPVSPAGPSGAAAPNVAKKYPEDSLASRVPADPGMYFFAGPAVSQIDLKFFLGAEEGKGLMKKGKAIAYLIGPAAKTRLKAAPAFYIRLPEGREIAELVLIGLSSKNGRRQLDVGAAGGKQQLDTNEIEQFDSTEIGPHLFRIKIATPKLPAGEYVFFFIGSADPSKGVYGKGYDFGIEAVRQEDPKHRKS